MTPTGSNDGRGPTQFGLASLLLLTAAIAAIFGLLRPMNLPPLAYGIFAAYASVMAGYLVLRGLFLWRRALRMRRRLQQRRDELQRWVDNRRASERAEVAKLDASGPTTVEDPRL